MTRLHTTSTWFLAAAVVAACGGASDFESQNGTPLSAGSTSTAGRTTTGGAGGDGATGGSLATGGTGTGGSSKGGTGGGGTNATGGSSGKGGTGTGGTGTGGTGTGGSSATGGSSGSGAAGRGPGGAGGSGGARGGMGGVGGVSSCPDTLPPNDAACSMSMACFYDVESGCLCENSSCLIVKPCRSSSQDAEDRAAPLAGASGLAGGSGIVAPPPNAITCVCDGSEWSCLGLAK